MKKKFAIKLRGKILSMFISVLLLLSTIVMFTVYLEIKNLSNEDIIEKLEAASNLGFALLEKQFSGDWRVDGTNLYKGDKKMNDDTEFVDSVKTYTGYPSTIFLQDTRVSTNILKEDGSRAVGTKVSENVAEVVLKNGKEYQGEAPIQGRIHEAKYTPIKDASGKVIGIWFTGVEKSSITKKINNLMLVILAITLILLTFAIIAVVMFANHIKKNISNISNTLDYVSNGNLQNECTVKSQDEFGDISKYINVMIHSLKQIVQNLQHSSMMISSSSNNLSATSTEMTSVTENIATSIGDVAEGTSLQASEMMNITSILNEFGNELDSIASRINNINDTSLLINNMARDSNNEMENLANSVEMVKTSFNEFGQKFDDLSVNLDKVNEITTLINSISDRTNLLSLNAAIEAARAGESGRGFAIVAEEIRKLADQSKESSTGINLIVRNVISENQIIVESTNLMKSEIENQANVIKSSITAFRNILNLINDVIPKIKSANDSILTINENKCTIVEKIESSSAVAEEISASAEEVAAASEELNASAEEVSATAELLSAMTKELVDISNKFKI